jgi:D-glycero-D-manno-heptose 1,7-bisphosphate phosphatase
MNRAVFLDRDGVINQAVVREGKPYPPNTLADLIILPGVFNSLQKLAAADYKLIVITNQPDVARGKTTRQQVETINQHLQNSLPILEIKTCFHDNSDQCQCRKPSPGALIEASLEYEIDLHASFMIGDRSSDVQAGASAGCKTFFIDYGYLEAKPSAPDYVVSSLTQAVEIILGEQV